MFGNQVTLVIYRVLLSTNPKSHSVSNNHETKKRDKRVSGKIVEYHLKGVGVA